MIFGLFLHIAYHQNMVVLNIHFEYQILTDLLKYLLWVREFPRYHSLSNFHLIQKVKESES